MPVSEESVDYYQKYKNLKRKFKFLIYENECFQEELKKAQRKLLKISRDKSFLLDRLLQYESIDSSSSDSEATESSDSEIEQKHEIPVPKKKKVVSCSASGDGIANAGGGDGFSNTPSGKGDGSIKKKKPPRKANSAKTSAATASTLAAVHADVSAIIREDGHMTSEEIERHLEAKQALRDLLPEKAPLTVPVELFSTELSGLDSDLMEAHSGDSPTRHSIEAVVEDGGLVIDLPE